MRENLDDPYVQLAATKDVLEGYDWLSTNLEKILDYLQTVEHQLSHIDAQPKNLFPGTRADGEPETVAIDWASLGYAALGMDVANLLGSSLMWMELDVNRAMQLDPLIFQGSMDGLDDVGWRGCREVVQLGYLTVVTARMPGSSTMPLTWIDDPKWIDWMQTNFGATPEEMVTQWRDAFAWMFPRLISAAERAGIA